MRKRGKRLQWAGVDRKQSEMMQFCRELKRSRIGYIADCVLVMMAEAYLYCTYFGFLGNILRI